MKFLRTILLGCLLAAGALGASAQPVVSRSDLEAALRALGFLDNLPRDGRISIAIVYLSSSGEKSQADEIASSLNAMAGPNSAALLAQPVAAEDLFRTQGRIDALYILPGTSSSAPAIGEFVRRRHVVSISNDPACLSARCCVLMVRTGNEVEIVLDTALADSAGAQFSTVFSMMVKRK